MSDNLSPNIEASDGLDTNSNENPRARVLEQSAAEIRTKPSFKERNNDDIVCGRKEYEIESLFHDSDVAEEDSNALVEDLHIEDRAVEPRYDHVRDEASDLGDQRVGVLDPGCGVSALDASVVKLCQEVDVSVVVIREGVGKTEVGGDQSGVAESTELNSSFSDSKQDIATESNSTWDKKQSIGSQVVNERPNGEDIVMVDSSSAGDGSLQGGADNGGAEATVSSTTSSHGKQNNTEERNTFWDMKQSVKSQPADEKLNGEGVTEEGNTIRDLEESVDSQSVNKKPNGGDVVIVGSSLAAEALISNTSESLESQPGSINSAHVPQSAEVAGSQENSGFVCPDVPIVDESLQGMHQNEVAEAMELKTTWCDSEKNCSEMNNAIVDKILSANIDPVDEKLNGGYVVVVETSLAGEATGSDTSDFLENQLVSTYSVHNRESVTVLGSQESSRVVCPEASVVDESLQGMDQSQIEVAAPTEKMILSDLKPDSTEENNANLEKKQSVDTEPVDKKLDGGDIVLVELNLAMGDTIANTSSLGKSLPVSLDSAHVMGCIDPVPDKIVENETQVGKSKASPRNEDQVAGIFVNDYLNFQMQGNQTVGTQIETFALDNGGHQIRVGHLPDETQKLENVNVTDASVPKKPDKKQHAIETNISVKQKIDVKQHGEAMEIDISNLHNSPPRECHKKRVGAEEVVSDGEKFFPDEIATINVMEKGTDAARKTEVVESIADLRNQDDSVPLSPDEKQSVLGIETSVPQKLDEILHASEEVSPLCQNRLLHGLVVDFDCSHSAEGSSNCEAEVSAPDEYHGGGVKSEEVACVEEISKSDENAANDVQEGAESDVGIQKVEVLESSVNCGAQDLPDLADTQTVKWEISSPGTSSLRKNFCATYYLPQKREDDFVVSDMVWGKIRSHPWWPGQIFDPSDSSQTALKYKRKDQLLVAYFGDGTFAWCDVSQLKPFLTHFPQMQKQSSSDAFLNAVDGALEEVSRRAQLGLACSCLPEEAYVSLKCQKVDNTGIREGANSAGGVGRFLGITSFHPGKLVKYIKASALYPCEGGDRLDLMIAKGQLTAFYHFKGYFKLTEFHIHGGLLENDVNLSRDMVEHATPVSKAQDLVHSDVFSGKRRQKSKENSSHKRKLMLEDGLDSRRKQRSLADLMSGKKGSKLVNSSSNSVDEKATQKSVSPSTGKKQKAIGSIPADSVQNKKKKLSELADSNTTTSERSFKVGDCIRKVASQLTGSPPILKCNGKRFQKNEVKIDESGGKSAGVTPRTAEEKQRRRADSHMEYSPHEMFSQLCLTARDPMKGYSFLHMIISFFTDFRNTRSCLGYVRHKRMLEETDTRAGSGKSTKPKTGSDETFMFNDTNDSYWTDRIVQCSPEEPPLFNSQKRKVESKQHAPKKKSKSARKPSNSLELNPKLDTDLDLAAGNQLGNPGGSSEKCFPTALILNFMEADSLPSKVDLINIFSRYGPLQESKTEIMRQTCRARVVFKRRSDAEVAFSSSGKFSIFGPALVSYKLKCFPSKPKSLNRSLEQDTKDALSLEANTAMSKPLGKAETTNSGLKDPGREET